MPTIREMPSSAAWVLGCLDASPTDTDSADVFALADRAGGAEYDLDPVSEYYERLTFDDGSVLTIAHGEADLGYPECFCQQSAGHRDTCPTLVDSARAFHGL